MSQCQTPDCTSPVRARGLCAVHYTAWHRSSCAPGKVRPYRPRQSQPAAKPLTLPKPWKPAVLTPDDLARLVRTTAARYHALSAGGYYDPVWHAPFKYRPLRESWAWVLLAQKLHWQYGPEAALAALNATRRKAA